MTLRDLPTITIQKIYESYYDNSETLFFTLKKCSSNTCDIWNLPYHILYDYFVDGSDEFNGLKTEIKNEFDDIYFEKFIYQVRDYFK
jgi:hypothetical protein